MNDFFSVLDDFEFEEFVALEDDGFESNFNFDTANDGSDGDVPPDPAKDDGNTDTTVIEVKDNKTEVTESGQYVWTSDGSPFSGSTGSVWLGVSSAAKTYADGGADSNLTYTEVSLSVITGLTFGTAKTEANPLQIAGKSNYAIAGTAGLSVSLSSGKPTGGKLNFGTGFITLWNNYTANADPYQSDDGKIRIAIEGFSAENPPEFGSNGSDLQSITETPTANASVTVTGDYKFTFNGAEVKINKVNTDDGAADSPIVFTYDEDLNLTLDITGVNKVADSTLEVKAAGGATELIAPATAAAGDTIKIGKVTYTYGSVNGTASFGLSGTDVTGYALRDVGDFITVSKNDDIIVYDEDIIDTSKLVSVDGANYTITKLAGGYSATITASTKVTIDDVTFDFSISNATKGTPITIYFDEDEIIGVNGLDKFTANDKMTVTGAYATDDESGIALLNAQDIDAAVGGYIAVNTGKFTYTGGNTPSVYVDSEATVYAVNDEAQVFVGDYTAAAAEGGTVTNNNNTFAYTGDGYLRADDNTIYGFVFTSANDSVTLPTDTTKQLALYYENLNTPIEVPAVTDTDGSFDVTMTEAGVFQIDKLSAGSKVDDRFTFENAGGTATFDAQGDILGIYGYTGSLTLTEADDGLIINGDRLTLALVNDQEVTAYSADGTKLDTIGILQPGDAVSSRVEGTNEDAETAFTFDGTGGTDVYTVNGRTYTVTDDDTGVTITADGKLTGLDEDAKLVVTGFGASEILYVNGQPYLGTNANGKDIIGYETKNEEPSSYMVDPNHPLFSSSTDQDDIKAYLGVDGAVNVSLESAVADPTLVDFSTVTGSAQYTFDTASNTTTGIDKVVFNNEGKNVAIVGDTATGNKEIVLGKKGDAVIMDGHDEYGTVNITTGAGNDTIVVRGNVLDPATDAVYKGSMTTTINMNSDGIDKVITYAAANADIVLNNYDVTGKSGVAFHDPELQYIKEDIEDAIKSGLLVFEEGSIVAIDRGEVKANGALPEGTDRKTKVTVNNVASNPATMVRLFGYKDASDSYSDDFGQVVGFTGSAGGTINASAFDEDVVLVGNYDGTKTAGSSLVTGAYYDTVFAGAGDTIDTGDGIDKVVLDSTPGRDAATIIVGRGAGDVVENLHSGFDGDIFDVTSYDGKLDYTFTDSVLGIIDESSKSTLLAQTDEDGQFVKQTFINGNDVLFAAVAEEGGTIKVTDDDDIVPNYYLAADGAIDFSAYSGDVGIDVDGEDLDYPSAVNGTSVSIGSAVNTLIGGTGTTIFKGGKGNETLVAGTGESSLYGGGGQNVLLGVDSSLKSGSTEFFVIGIHNGAQNSIGGFEFVADGATNQATFDNLNLGMADGNDVTDIKVVNGTDVAIAVKGGESGATEKATIVGAAGAEMLVDRGTDTETVAQIAASEVTISHDYVDFYAATEDNASVKIGNVSEARVWLESPEHNGVNGNENHTEYVGAFSVIDASTSSAAVEMAGNNAANTIIGGLGNASMWGGSGSANDVMIAGSAHNEFYYEVGNGDDTIIGGNDGDIIHLGMSLDQVNFDATEMGASAIVVNFNNGGSLTVNNTAEVTFSFDDGTNVKANRQTGQFE